VKRYKPLKEGKLEQSIDKLRNERFKLLIIHGLDYEDGQFSADIDFNNGRIDIKGNYLIIKDGKTTIEFNVNKITNFEEKDRYYSIKLKNLTLDLYL